VTTTWSLSFEKITQSYPAAAELLDFCAFLYPDAIPEEIITVGASFLGTPIESLATDPLQLDGTMKEILRYSLIQREPDRQISTPENGLVTARMVRSDHCRASAHPSCP